ncbi:MAG TPA: haloacid dehalogenase-like hydrolase [Actinomycetes bacterium]|nr:haloacid dehalogenase-like hydrolase [Actinomycetes bacterium]
MRRLVLWDVDGTLVNYAGLGWEAFLDAFLVVMGRPAAAMDGSMIALAGRTDPEIALELLAAQEVPDAELRLEEFHTALEAALAAKAAVMRERGQALPGAEEVLAALQHRPEVVQSLLTGNLRANAMLKVATFGLDRYLDLEVGAYGSDHRERPRLVTVARAKAKAKYGVDLDPRATVLIGDTPLDVAAAQAEGARVVAVASGRYDAETLHAVGADVVLPDLRDTAAAVRAVLAGP